MLWRTDSHHKCAKTRAVISEQQPIGTAWSKRIDTDAAYRRASGRRHYNAVRSFIQAHRRAEVARLLTCKGALFRRGLQTELARELNVSRSTICRDIAYLLRLGWPCPHCGAYTRPLP